MAGQFRTLSQLREVILGMERDLGLDRLAANDRDLLYAVDSLFVSEASPVRTEALRAHALVKAMPQATFHRAGRNHVVVDQFNRRACLGPVQRNSSASDVQPDDRDRRGFGGVGGGGAGVVDLFPPPGCKLTGRS